MIQKMDVIVDEVPVNPLAAIEGFGTPELRAKYRFTADDIESEGYRTTAVAKVNGYMFAKGQSNSDGHAEDHLLDQLYKATYAARNAVRLFVEPPAKNLLTIYVTKSPCSSTYKTSGKDIGCAEEIIQHTTINGYEFDIKVRYAGIYKPKMGPGSADRSREAADEMNYFVSSRHKNFFGHGKDTTRRRGEPHPMRDIKDMK